MTRREKEVIEEFRRLTGLNDMTHIGKMRSLLKWVIKKLQEERESEYSRCINILDKEVSELRNKLERQG